MAYSSEIDKLRARYAENPKGRNFAPLADAFRKAKQLDEAIALCREGLQHHPDYVSAHIVLGRCLVDKQDDVAAETSFQRVLELDPENIIALKLLSDIALRADRPHDAVGWLTRLLQVDPMNGDASEALTVARGRLAAAAAAPVSAPLAATAAELPALAQPPVAEPVPPPAEPGPPAPSPGAAPGRSVPSPSFAEAPTAALSAPHFMRPTEPEGAAVEPALESYDGSIDFSGVESAAQPIAGLSSEESPVDVAPDDVAPAAGLARTHYEGSGMFRVDNDAAEANLPRPSRALGQPSADTASDLPLILPDADERRARESSGEPAAPRPEPAAAPTPPPVAAALPEGPPAAGAGIGDRPAVPVPTTPDDEGAADEAALSAAEPLVTETMAELYLQQGHVEQALQVYRALLAQHPGDANLQGKIDSLAGPGPRGASGGAGPPAQSALEFLRNVFAGDRAAPPVAVDEADGESVRTAETVMDAVFAGSAAEPDDAQRGAPTQPAKDALSLDRVFGESGAAPAPEPGMEKGAAVGAPVGFSFDDFFTGNDEAPPVGASSGGASATRAGARPSRPTEPEQDLDQFQAWLRSLKT